MNNSRALLLTFGLFIGFVILTVRLFTIQISDHEHYAFYAEKQQNKALTVKAERGLIKDRYGEVLSFTKDNISFFVDKRMMNEKKVDSIASRFAKVFNRDKKYYKNLISKGRNNICIEKKAPKGKALLLHDFVIDGLFTEEDFTRVYPYGSLASHILGYVNNDFNGVDGVEKFYDDELKGNDGSVFVERDVMGRTVTVNDELTENAVPGNNLILTINKTYQQILEEELSAGIKKFQADSAVGIIMNPNNGEILAMTNLPQFDPNNYNLFDNDSRRDRAITDAYEPGSTMKAVTMSMLLDKNLVNENEIIQTNNGVYKLANVKIKDSHEYKQLTVKEVLEHSSNIGMAKLSDRIDPDDFYKGLRDFGFSNPTSIDLPGEINGYLKTPDRYSKISKAFMSFGYEIAVTPLQMITAFCSLVNGGILYQPHVLKEITNYKNEVIKNVSATKIRRTIKEETSQKIKEFMVGVVEQGTAESAQLSDVLVGGKTGTSQIYDSEIGYIRNKYNTSFIGFLPVDNPQIVCLILVNSPSKAKYGGTVAAPIFKKIAKRLVSADINIVPDKDKIERKKEVFDQLFADINNDDGSTKFYNPGENGNQEAKKGTVIVRTTMPNLRNYSLREAMSILTELGIKYKIKGNGNVTSQSIEPGTKLSDNMYCVLKCETGKSLSSLRIN